MGHREKYEVPDWVVKDYNSRVPQEDRLPLYDGADDSDYECSSNEYPSSDRVMVAFRKALRTGDYTEYNKLEMEQRILWYGARGISKEQVMKMFYEEKPPTVIDKIKEALCKFIFYLLLFLFAIWIFD